MDTRRLMAFTLVLALPGCSGGEGEATHPETDGEPGPTIGPPPSLEFEVVYPEAFSFLNGVRELSDGRVLAADPFGQVVLRIDLDAGKADTLGGVGPGPEEYMEPDQVLPLTGDSTLLRPGSLVSSIPGLATRRGASTTSRPDRRRGDRPIRPPWPASTCRAKPGRPRPSSGRPRLSRSEPPATASSPVSSNRGMIGPWAPTAGWRWFGHGITPWPGTIRTGEW